MKVRMKGQLLKVDDPKTGLKYHVSWAKHGCVWHLISIDKEAGTGVMQTPKTKKQITVKLEDLRHTRSNQVKLMKK